MKGNKRQILSLEKAIFKAVKRKGKSIAIVTTMKDLSEQQS